MPTTRIGNAPSNTSATPTFTGLTLSGLTEGSVLFAGSGGVISQENATLFYSASLNSMGIGTNSPAAYLEVQGTDLTRTYLLLDVPANQSADVFQHKDNGYVRASINKWGQGTFGLRGATVDSTHVSTNHGLNVYDELVCIPGLSGFTDIQLWYSTAGTTSAAIGLSVPGTAASLADLYLCNYSSLDGSGWKAGLIIKQGGDMERPIPTAAARGLEITGATSQSGNYIHLQNVSAQLGLAIDSAFKLQWADAAGGAADTNLYRSAANILTTDDSVTIGGTTSSGRLTVHSESGYASSDGIKLYSNDGFRQMAWFINGSNQFELSVTDGASPLILNGSGEQVTTGGALTVTGAFIANESGANVDSRIEGDTDVNLIFVDASADSVGIGDSTPSEKLDINGRVRLASIAGSTNDGATWNDSTQKAIQTYVDGVEQTISGCIFTATATATVSNTVTETTLIGSGVGTLTLPADFFVAGKTIRLRLRGIYGSTAGNQLTFRVKLGSTTICSALTSPYPGDANQYFEVCADITCRTTGGTGTVFGQSLALMQNSFGTNEVVGLVNTGTDTIDTTASQAVSVTAQWSAADAGDTISGTNFTLEVLN